jgi:hypothetical protein
MTVFHLGYRTSRTRVTGTLPRFGYDSGEIALLNRAHHAVIDQEDRSAVAGPEAFRGDNGEGTVLSDSIGLYLEMLAQTTQYTIGPAQHTGDIFADMDQMCTDRFFKKHIVEGDHGMNLVRVDAEEGGYLLLSLSRQIAHFFLGQMQSGDESRAFFRIRLLQLDDRVAGGFRKH